MLAYHFSMRDSGTELELLGYDAFESDTGAIAFGQQIIDDLVREAPEQYFGWTMEIAEGTRNVANISFTKGSVV